MAACSVGRMETLNDDDRLAGRQQLEAQAALGDKRNWSTPFVSNVDGEVVMTYRAPIRRCEVFEGLLTTALR